MRFLHLNIAKSDAQWTEEKALKCWSDENEEKLEVKSGDKTPVTSSILNCFDLSLYQRHIVLLEIVALANYKEK